MSTRPLRRRVLNLALPVIGENLLQTLLGIVDTILVASLGAAALAGVGAALQVVFVIIAALSAFSVGTSVLVAQAVGAGTRHEASDLARQTLVWSLLIALPISLLGWALLDPIVALFGLAPDVAHIAADYLRVTLATIATLVVMLLVSGALRGAGDSRTPMLVTLVANLVNIGFSYALIYGAFGLPALGAVGSAWGTFAARLLGAALLVGALWRGRAGLRLAGPARWWPRRAVMRTVMKIGAPAALEELLIITALASLTPIVAALGTPVLAAHRVVINVLSISFLPGIGFGIAATALVGNAVGAHRSGEAAAVTAIATRWAVLWMGALGALFFFCATQLMTIFTADPAIIAPGAGGIVAVALTQPFWAATFVYAGALRGTGDTRTPLVISGAAMWLVAALAFVLVRWFDGNLATVWGTFLFISPLESAALWWAWRRWCRTNERSAT